MITDKNPYQFSIRTTILAKSHIRRTVSSLPIIITGTPQPERNPNLGDDGDEIN